MDARGGRVGLALDVVVATFCWTFAWISGEVMSKTCRDICLEIWRQREMSRHVATFAKTRAQMPLPRSEGQILVKSQESRPKKFCAIIAFLTSLCAISAAFSRFSRTFESKNMLSDRAHSVWSENFHRRDQMSCHVATFAKDSGEVMSCRVATFARSLETFDINICLNPDDILLGQ